MSLVDEYYSSKKLTYHNTWDLSVSEQFPEGGVHWVLFIIEDEFHTPYYFGVEPNHEQAISEMKWAIGTYLKSHGML